MVAGTGKGKGLKGAKNANFNNPGLKQTKANAKKGVKGLGGKKIGRKKSGKY